MSLAVNVAVPPGALSAFDPSYRVHPASTLFPYTTLFRSTSSPSPDTAIPDSVIVDPGSSLPLKLVGPPKVGASATPNAVTVRISDPVAEGPLDPSREVTVRVRTAVSPPWSGAVILSAPRSLAANVAVPPGALSAVAPS